MRDFFVGLGSTAAIHPRDMPQNTRLVWCVDGSARGTDVNWFAAQKYPLVGVEKRAAKPVFQEKVNGAEWAAMSNQFFTTILTPLNAKVGEVWGRRFDVKAQDGSPIFGIEGAMGMPGFELQPGQTSTLHFQLYVGPKLYDRLAKLSHDEAEIMNFGMLKLVSQALLNFLNLLHGWVRNYGLAIILLTACVKGVLWPLQNKANKSMRKMSALAPKMQELKEKYKDDPTRMNQEVMKLYKEHGVNPVGGCLPMMIQIPIFFGLFSMLGQAAELRNASFLWVHDLSQPDTVAIIPGLGWIPILATGRRSNHQSPSHPHGRDQRLAHAHDAEDRRTTQQRVMMFMPLIFLFFCYNFAAALALYYTTQNLFTILQLYQNQKATVPVLEKVRADQACEKDDHDAQGTTRHHARLSRLRRADRRERSEAGNLTLQIYTEESAPLIGRDGETLEAIQFLLNRLIQRKIKDAEKVIVDCEHYRSMREDKIVQRVRELAERVRISGRSLQLEPMNSYERRIVHNAFKDDPDVATWSPSDSARIKQITLLKRQKREAAPQPQAKE